MQIKYFFFVRLKCSFLPAVFEGAQTKMGPPPLFCFTNWYMMVAEVTVFPVPGGP